MRGNLPLRRWTFYHLHSQYVIILKVIWCTEIALYGHTSVHLQNAVWVVNNKHSNQWVCCLFQDLVRLVFNVATSSQTYCYEASSWSKSRSFLFILIAWMNLEGLCKCSYGYQEQDKTTTPPLQINFSYNRWFFRVCFWCMSSINIF